MAMTLQEAFNASYIGVIKQGRRSIDANGNCVYNDGNGCKCGIGHTMPDGTDVSGCNLSGVRKLLEVRYPAVAHLSDIDVDALMELQGCHDLAEFNGAFISNFTQNMKFFAQAHHLTIPTI